MYLFYNVGVFIYFYNIFVTEILNTLFIEDKIMLINLDGDSLLKIESSYNFWKKKLKNYEYFLK